MIRMLGEALGIPDTNRVPYEDWIGLVKTTLVLWGVRTQLL
jgi:hypothetical protein